MHSDKTETSYFFTKINNRILSLCRKIETIKGDTPELIAFVLWCLFHFVVSAYHERWFDEAVAWQIAKNATMKDLLFSVPHYEGHPFLWHLILRPLAKLGVSYSFALTLTSFVIMGSAVFLVLFKTNIPRIIRLFFPFTYFILYQYGIIARPYCLMTLCFILLAMAHKERNEHTLRYVLILFLLCLSSAFGIVIACGISLAWLVEIVRDAKFNIAKLLSDKRIKSLVLLLVLALILVAMIIPKEDTFASFSTKNEMTAKILFTSFIYTLFALPADALVTNSLNEESRLLHYSFTRSELISGVLIGMLILSLVVYYGKRKHTLLYILIPHLLFASFSACVYFTIHHIGIWYILFFYWLLITVNENGIYAERESKITLWASQLYGIAGFIIIMISVYQGINSGILDISKDYTYAKQIADYLEEKNLEKYNIMINWQERSSGSEKYSDFDMSPSMVFQYMTPADTINAYLGYNIFYNYFDGDDKAYIDHKVASQEELDKIISRWREKGYPDILVGLPNLAYVFGKKDLYNRYVAIFKASENMIWKGYAPFTGNVYIFMRKDLAEKLGIKAIPKPALFI